VNSRDHLPESEAAQAVRPDEAYHYVRACMARDNQQSRVQAFHPEYLDAAAELVAPMYLELHGCVREVAQLAALDANYLEQQIRGSRSLLVTIAALRHAGRKMAEPRAAIIGLARALVAPYGLVIDGAPATGNVVQLAAAVDQVASDIAAGMMDDLSGDGVISPQEAMRQLPKARRLALQARALEERLGQVAASPKPAEVA